LIAVNAATDQTDPLSAGQVLASERERQGLSRAEMAQRLRITPWQVEALEIGDYERLPKGPFIRGFVRNYARALGIDAEALLEQLAQEGPHEAAPRIVVPTQNIRFDPLGERFASPYLKAAGLAVVAILLAFAAMYWWLFIRTAPPASYKPATEQAAPAVATPPPSATAPLEPAPAAPASEPQAAPPQVASPAVDAASTPAPAPAEGEAVLRFHFKGDSWVEVRDAKGRVLMQRTNAANSDATVTGQPPLRVIVGNAQAVTLRFNDRDFPLEPHTKLTIARFTLE
jgi:cytoskeleton protein RodZ